MNPKVTVIGAAPAPPVPAPTRVDGGARQNSKSPSIARPETPEQPATFPPTTLRPSVISPAAQATAAVEHDIIPTAPLMPGPTTIKASTSAAAAPTRPKKPFQPSSLPGVQRKPVQVTMTELIRRFPQAHPDALEHCRAVLNGVHVQSMDAAGWLNFGMPEQERFAGLMKQRLKLAQEPSSRMIPQHLARLHDLLKEVLDAFEGGFLKKPAAKVWTEHEEEVQQLERLLNDSDEVLAEHLRALGRLKGTASECGEQLEATALAAEYLLDQVDGEVGGLLVARLTSLTESPAMLRDHLLFLAQDLSQTQDLITLVQDGVLLKLPAVYSQLAGLTIKPSETQRFLAAEKLTDVLQTLKRKNL